MLTKKSFILFISLFFSSLVIAANGINHKCYGDPAVKEVKDVVDDILVDLAKNKPAIQDNPKVVYKIIDRLLVPKADFKVMSQLVLTRNWKKLSDKQKSDFILEFSRSMIRTYGIAFEAYDDETVDIHCPVRKLKGKHKRVEVRTTIHHLKQPDNTVLFRLLKVNKVCKACKKDIKVCKDLATDCKDIKKTGSVDNYNSCKAKYDDCKSSVEQCSAKCDVCKACDKGKADSQDCSSCFSWQVYDLIVDNISIIDSYRQVFTDKFRKEKNINKIIADMREQNCKTKMFAC